MVTIPGQFSSFHKSIGVHTSTIRISIYSQAHIPRTHIARKHGSIKQNSRSRIFFSISLLSISRKPRTGKWIVRSFFQQQVNVLCVCLYVYFSYIRPYHSSLRLCCKNIAAFFTEILLQEHCVNSNLESWLKREKSLVLL